MAQTTRFGSLSPSRSCCRRRLAAEGVPAPGGVRPHAARPGLLAWAAAAGLAVVCHCAPNGPTPLACRTDGSLGACCDPEQAPCAPPLVCLDGGEGTAVCTATCDPDTGAGCPDGATCVAGPAGGRCEQAGGVVGALCASASDCRTGLTCLDLGDYGVCTAACDAAQACPDTERVGKRLCVRLSHDAGTYCMRPCSADADCASPLRCTPVGDSGASVCFPQPP